jgi:hypothetical protein
VTEARDETEVLTALLERPPAGADAAVLAAIEAGPIDPALALPLDQIDRLLDPRPLAAETGWCFMPDATAFVAVRTQMPGVSAEMIDWWFDWHPRESLRYRVWHPAAHIANAVDLPERAGAKAHWGTVHHPVEDVGTGELHARISFLPPSELGFATDALENPNVGTVVCGVVGDDRMHARHSVMAHVWLNERDGLALRSAFWLGAVMRPDLPGPLGDVAGWLVNRPPARRRLLQNELPQALALHCAQEYTNLAELLPDLYSRFA